MGNLYQLFCPTHRFEVMVWFFSIFYIRNVSKILLTFVVEDISETRVTVVKEKLIKKKTEPTTTEIQLGDLKQTYNCFRKWIKLIFWIWREP